MSSTRPTSSTRRAPVRCSTRSAFGTEFGRQSGIDVRNTGIFPNGTNTIVGNPFNPTYFGPVTFIHHFTGANTDGVTTADFQQQISAEHAVGLCARHDRNHALSAVDRRAALSIASTSRRLDMNTSPGTRRNRVDNKLSPQAAVIVKPMENLSIYGVYSVSYPAGLRRPVQRAEQRHRDPRAAEVREQGGRRQMEHLSAAALQRRRLRPQADQCAAGRSEQSGILHPVGQQPDPAASRPTSTAT